MFRQIHTSIWAETWFESWLPEAKLLFLYFITHPHISPAGYLTSSLERIAFETKLSIPSIHNAISALTEKVLSNGSSFWVRRFSRWQGGGPKWQKAVSNAVSDMPPFFQEAFKKEYPDGLDTPSIPYPYPTDKVSIPEGDKEKEKEKDNDNKNRRRHPSDSPPDPRVKEISQALEELRGFKSPAYGKEAAAIKWMLGQGHEADTILGCYQALKQQSFWKDKPLDMAQVKKNIGEWVHKREVAAPQTDFE